MSTRVRVGAILKVVAVNVAVLAALLGVAEIWARLAYPEFHGHIHSATQTLGVNHYSADFEGVPVRVPHPGYQPSAGRPLFVVLGDSVSNGYGLAYEDIYWVRLHRIVERGPGAGLEFVAFSAFGNSLADSAKGLESLASRGVTVRFVLYQFNLNDVTPYGRAQLRSSGNLDKGSRDFDGWAEWRYEYLNRSVFMRVAQHYAGIIRAQTSGSCEERGLDALGPYTWTFGSAKYREEAEELWREFEETLGTLKQSTDRLGAQLAVFVSPLVFDVDTAGRHPHFNHTRLDFSCGTIDPRARLARVAETLGIQVADPAAYLREKFEARIAENNFTPFFHTADENHFNAVAGGYVAEYLAAELFGAAPTGPHPDASP